ncbi:MAG TPA: SOS response-associated peptidase [Dehalococcoidia bacterium]
MCGRFTLTRKSFRELATELDAFYDEEFTELYRPRFNVAPTDPHWIVRTKQERRELLPAKWGLVNSWSKSAKGAFKQINARSESALTRPAFREAFEKRRCVVPADGFFEWKGAKEARRPIWFHAPDAGLLLFAGLYETWHDPLVGDRQRTFTILTTSANNVVAPVHDRMPVILPAERVDDWLHIPTRNAVVYANDLRTLLAPADERTLVATEVSRRVNSVANDDEACLAPANDAEYAEAPRLL